MSVNDVVFFVDSFYGNIEEGKITKSDDPSTYQVRCATDGFLMNIEKDKCFKSRTSCLNSLKNTYKK